jgi:hypothetical protein
MSKSNISNSDVKELSERLDVVLYDAPFENDSRRAAEISIEFCRFLTDQLDPTQQQALEVAERYWAAGKEERYVQMVEEFSRRIDFDQRSNAPEENSVVNRLIWSALNRNSGLSTYDGAFLIDCGLQAGLSPNQMAGVFGKYVPGFLGS